VIKETITETLHQAIRAYNIGDLATAKELFARIIDIDPNQPDANHNMGTLFLRAGDLEKAVPFFKTALEANFGSAQYWFSYIDTLFKAGHYADALELFKISKTKGCKGEAFDNLERQLNSSEFVLKRKLAKLQNPALVNGPKGNLIYLEIGETFEKLNMLEEAIEAYKSALEIDPNYETAYIKLGNVLKGQGKLAEAVAAYKKVLEIKPDHVTAHFNIGVILQEQGRSDEAIIAYNKALSIRSDFLNAHINLGNTFKSVGKFEEAIGAYKNAIALKPDYAEAYRNFGTALQDQGKLEEAIKVYRKALDIKPDYAEVHYNIGNCFVRRDNLGEAIAAYKKALSIKPGYAEAYNNIGLALSNNGKIGEAIEFYDKAIAIKPDYAEAYSNMGVAFADQGKFEEAIGAYKNAIALKPDYAEAYHNMSIAFLVSKDFEQGFKYNEWRWRTQKFIGKYLKSTKPTWNGEKQQRVLVWAEQGVGDEIMFSSILLDLHKVSSKVIVQCDVRLKSLFARSFPEDIRFFSRDHEVPEDQYDYHVPMGSLGRTLRKSLHDFEKTALGFLEDDKQKTQILRDSITGGRHKKLVGISWKTFSTNRHSANRNIKLADMAGALNHSNAHLVCLQYGDISDEILAVKKNLGIEIVEAVSVDTKNDLDSFVSLVAACDQVVTIDNSTVHFAGALGIPTKLMLPYVSDWRWGLENKASYWYDSVQIYRQQKVSDWRAVIRNL
jgi:tetratricopeptide (TPR) repeat protein